MLLFRISRSLEIFARLRDPAFFKNAFGELLEIVGPTRRDGSSLSRTSETFAPSCCNRGARSRATRKVMSPSWTGALSLT